MVIFNSYVKLPEGTPKSPAFFRPFVFCGWQWVNGLWRLQKADSGGWQLQHVQWQLRNKKWLAGDWLLQEKMKHIQEQSFLFDYIDMTYIFIWRYDLYDLYEDMTSSPQSIGMIVPGSLERLNHKNNLKKNSNEFFEFLVLTQYLEIFGTTCCKNGSTIVPSGGPASSWLSIDLAELMEKVGAKMKDCHCFS